MTETVNEARRYLEMQAYYTPEQVAKALQVNVVTIYRWLRSGKLHGSHITQKMWRISETDLKDLLENDCETDR